MDFVGIDQESREWDGRDEESKAQRCGPDHGHDIEDAILRCPAVEEKADRDPNATEYYGREAMFRFHLPMKGLLPFEVPVGRHSAEENASHHAQAYEASVL